MTYPLIGRGWTLVLDWALGPHQHLPPGQYGFSTPSSPLPAVLLGAQHLIGGAALSWLVIAASFPLALVGAALLIPAGRVGRLAGGALYAVNPFVFERIGAGQVDVLLAYGVLPFAVRSILSSEDRRGWQKLCPALWLAILVALSVNFLFIGVVPLVVLALWRHRVRTILWALANLALSLVLDAYLVLPLAGNTGASGVAVGTKDLESYRTVGDQTWGLFVNVLGLYGFWRPAYVLPKQRVSGWLLFLGVIILVAVVGIRTAWRRRPARDLVMVALISAFVGYFLALGDQGPTASLFVFAYRHVPAFNVMREPEKFAALVALFYAVAFGLGAQRVVGSLRDHRARAGACAVAVALPLIYCPTIFGGLDGQLAASRYPRSWAAANRVMGAGPGQILALPWHEYLSFPWTHGEVIANPAPGAFSRPVISGDNVEVSDLETDSTSKRSAYLEALFAAGPRLTEFGHLVAQLGVRYVVLADTVDYGNYAWLNHQHDLREVFDSGGLQVWRNGAALPQGARLTETLSVPSLSDYINLAQRSDLRGAAVFEQPKARPPDVSPSGEATPVLDVRRRSAVSFGAAAGPAGWVVLPEDARTGWQLDGRSARATIDGVTALPSSGQRGEANYVVFRRVEVGDVVSGAAVLVLGGLIFGARRRGRSAARRDRSMGNVCPDQG